MSAKIIEGLYETINELRKQNATLTAERDGARSVAVRYWRRYRRHFNAIGVEDHNEDAIISSWDHLV